MAEQPKKILLVDDEPDILEFLRYNLQKEGHQIFTAGDGKSALAEAEKSRPDLIVLDIMMPEMDGIEVCRRLREDKKFDSAVIAFLTARDEDFTQIAALDVGGDDYISKPIKPRVFISRINALLRRGEKNDETGTSEKTLEFPSLTIDREKVLVFRDGSPIDLPKKEFEILWLLASRPGKVFTRDEIFDKIWGADVIVGARTIDVHIRKLRERIGEDFIKTLKGIGYKFEF